MKVDNDVDGNLIVEPRLKAWCFDWECLQSSPTVERYVSTMKGRMFKESKVILTGKSLGIEVIVLGSKVWSTLLGVESEWIGVERLFSRVLLVIRLMLLILSRLERIRMKMNLFRIWYLSIKCFDSFIPIFESGVDLCEVGSFFVIGRWSLRENALYTHFRKWGKVSHLEWIWS